MSLWSDAEYRFFPFYFPHAPLHLHVMLTACGFEVRRDHTYDWNGLQRGDRPFCIFQCTLEGEGQLTVDGKAYRMKPGDAMLLSVPENHRYTLPSDSTHWKHIYLNFSGSEAVRIWTELKHKYGSVVHLPLERSKTLETAFSVWTAAKNKRIRSALRASAFAYDFLMTLSEELAELELAQSEASFALDAVKYCMDHYAEDITVAEIADAAGYSRCHFSRMFTRVHGSCGSCGSVMPPGFCAWKTAASKRPPPAAVSRMKAISAGLSGSVTAQHPIFTAKIIEIFFFFLDLS